MLLKKINLSYFLILILFFLIFKNTNFFKNTYNIIYKSHNIRQQNANDFCDIFGSGYIFYIKEKFKLKKSPRILNSVVKQHWIFPDNYKIIDASKLIIINYGDKVKFDLKNYKIQDNFNNRCLFLEKK